jgi:hypothetical protein
MSDASSAATPLPTPEPGSDHNLKIVPDESKKRRSPSALNQAQVQTVNHYKTVVVSAQDPELAPALAQQGISAEFVTALLTRIDSTLECGCKAVVHSDSKEGATLNTQDAAQELVNELRTAQAKARQAYFHSDPTKLKDYFIGERVDANRGTLDQTAKGIVTRLNEERPAGVKTEFITRVEDKRQAFTEEAGKQSAAGGKAMTERERRNDAVESIKRDGQQIQFAADAAWPPHVPGNRGIRRRFHLPLTRPFTA